MLTIRNLDESLISQLYARAVKHNRPMEEEALAILRSALSAPQPKRNLASRLHKRFKEATDGIDLEIPDRKISLDSSNIV